MTYMRNPTNTAKGGIFYVKVVSGGSGTLKVELVKETPPEGGATLLQYDVPTPVSGDTAMLYAIPKAWTSATRFNTPTDHLFKMYIGLTPDFLTKDAVGVYPFSVTDQGHWCGLTKAELDALAGRAIRDIMREWQCRGFVTSSSGNDKTVISLDYGMYKYSFEVEDQGDMELAKVIKGEVSGFSRAAFDLSCHADGTF